MKKLNELMALANILQQIGPLEEQAIRQHKTFEGLFMTPSRCKEILKPVS